MSAPWLRGGSGFPDGGISLSAEYRRGSKSSHLYMPDFNPILGPRLGGDLFPGSLNLWADFPVELPAPAATRLGGIDWLFSPIVVAGRGVGVVGRRPEQDRHFLEVFARDKLVDSLGLIEGSRVDVQLFSGDYLAFAA